jgi:quinol monooxygenase YgiN
MILVMGRYSIDPAKREAFLAFARELVAQERRQPGCLAFDIFEDVTTPNAFLMMEQWENEDVLDAHTSSEAFERSDAALNEFIVGEPSWDEYQF